MKKRILFSFCLIFILNFPLTAKQCGLIFQSTDTMYQKVNIQGINFICSDNKNSTVLLMVEPHPLNSDNFYLNLIIGLKSQENYSQEIHIAPEQITLTTESVDKEQKIVNCNNPQKIADDLLLKKTFFDNAAYIAQEQKSGGLIGLGIAKKQIRESVEGKGDPSVYALLGDYTLDSTMVSCAGLALAPMINKKCKKMTVAVPVGKETHLFTFEVQVSREIPPLSSPFCKIYFSSEKTAKSQSLQIKAQIASASINAFNQGMQQSQTQSPAAAASGQDYTSNGVPGATYQSDKMYLEGQINLRKSQLQRAENNYKTASPNMQMSYSFEIDRLNNEISKYEMQLLELEQKNIRE